MSSTPRSGRKLRRAHWDSPRRTKPSEAGRDAAQDLAAAVPAWWVGFPALLRLRPAQEARPWGAKTRRAPEKHTGRRGRRPSPNPEQGALSAALGILLSKRVTVFHVYGDPLPSQSSTISKIKNKIISP